MSEIVRGKVVKVFGDIVSVAVSDNVLPLMGTRGTYVRIETRKGRELLGIVSNINLYDELYRASSGRISVVESYSDIALTRNEVIVSLLGTIVRKNGSIRVERKIDIVPSPGDAVYLMDKGDLQKIFSAGDIRIGVLTTMRDVEVRLNLNELATKHVAILAMTGYGKSNTLGVLLVRMLKNFDHPRILLIDTHSEYVHLGRKSSPIASRTIVYAPMGKFKEFLQNEGIPAENLEVPYWLLTLEEWYSILNLDSRATRQRRAFRDALREIKGGNLNAPIYFDLDTLRDSIRNSNNDDLIEKFEDAVSLEEYSFIFRPEKSLEIMQDESVGDIKERVRRVMSYVTRPIIRDGLKIISLGGLSSEVQNAVVSMLLRTMFRIAVESKLGGTPVASIIAVEEAHVYAPERYNTAARSIIEKIAKEGRKFGLGLILISQRPRELSQTVLAQCGTLIALRTVNPQDQSHIMRSLEDVSTMISSSLSGLGKGEAIISGPAVPVPCVVQVDYFEWAFQNEFGAQMNLGGKDVDFRSEWRREIGLDVVERILSRVLSEEIIEAHVNRHRSGSSRSRRRRRSQRSEQQEGLASLSEFLG